MSLEILLADATADLGTGILHGPGALEAAIRRSSTTAGPPSTCWETC